MKPLFLDALITNLEKEDMMTYALDLWAVYDESIGGYLGDSGRFITRFGPPGLPTLYTDKTEASRAALANPGAAPVRVRISTPFLCRDFSCYGG